MNKNNNTNLNILITGATGGLGKSFVKAFCNNENNHLFLTSTSRDKMNKLITEINSVYPNITITPFICNLLEEQSIENVIEFLKENNIQIDYLVNNAGYITEGSINNATTNTLSDCIKVNCLGTTQITKKILDLHNKSKLLKIITITSLAADYPMPYMAVYSSTKAYLKNFMLSLGYEYKKDNVLSLVVQPGAIATSDAMKEAIKAQGLKGKLSAVSPYKIAHNSIKAINSGKKIYTPGIFNKITKFISVFIPTNIKMKAIATMWKKSQDKRNIK